MMATREPKKKKKKMDTEYRMLKNVSTQKGPKVNRCVCHTHSAVIIVIETDDDD